MRSVILFLLLGFATSAALAQIPSGGAVAGVGGQTPVVAIPTNPRGGGGGSGLLGGYMEDATYKLRVGDEVSFQIREDRIWNALDTPKELVVTDSGELDVPYIGRVMAVDKTCGQLAAELKVALEKDYYQKATVVLSLNTANRLLGRIYILGQVRSQGPLDMQMNENLTAGQAILRAGGFAEFANKNKVKVVRGSAGGPAGGPGEKQVTFELDMQQILENGKTEQDIKLQPGDLIIVPSRLLNF
jgi:protein involved in polysaccharide export with SLBB domain